MVIMLVMTPNRVGPDVASSPTRAMPPTTMTVRSGRRGRRTLGSPAPVVTSRVPIRSPTINSTMMATRNGRASGRPVRIQVGHQDLTL